MKTQAGWDQAAGAGAEAAGPGLRGGRLQTCMHITAAAGPGSTHREGISALWMVCKGNGPSFNVPFAFNTHRPSES